MKTSQAILFLLTLVTTIHAFALPDFHAITDRSSDLWKRRGGGGGRGGGGRGGGSSGGSSGGSRGGSGPPPRAYSGGSFYPGGAAAPYRAGGRSPGGITPAFLPVAALGFFPGIWLYGAYAYPYHGLYHYHNDTSNQNESRPMECLCARYQECGCDGNNETDYVTSVANNNSVARVANVDGQQKLVVNGTLPNGTTAASAGASFRQGLVEMSGYWVMGAIVVYTVWFI